MLGGMLEDTELPESRRARLWEAADVRGVPLRAIVTTIALVVLTLLLGRILDKLRTILLLIVVAGFVALLVNPAVVLLQRWKLRHRGAAVAVVTAAVVLLFIGLATAFGYPLVDTLTHLAHNLPHYVTQVRNGKGPIGRLARKYHVQRWVDTNLVPKLTTFAKNLSKPALTLGKGALSLLFDLFVIFVLVVLLLLEGPKLRRGILTLMRPERSAQVWRISAEVSRSVTGFMLGNFVTSVIAGVVVFATLIVMGVPFAFLWALWVALFDFLPMIGGAVAGIPTGLFALTHSISAAIVFVVVFLTYTQVENHVLNPIVMSRTVRINPLLVLVAILFGANIGDLVGGFFGGFVGTLLAIPVAGGVQVIVRELWRSTSPDVPVDVAPAMPTRVP